MTWGMPPADLWGIKAAASGLGAQILPLLASSYPLEALDKGKLRVWIPLFVLASNSSAATAVMEPGQMISLL